MRPARFNRSAARQVKRLLTRVRIDPVHEKQIEIRWRDLDAYQHVNNAVYSTYLEECRDEWLELVLGTAEDATYDFVIARLRIDFRRELRLEDDAVLVRCGLAELGNSSVTTQEEILVGAEMAAEAEAVLVFRDVETKRPRPLLAAERSALAG
jgi:acyl-CoA thioester hydrolase